MKKNSIGLIVIAAVFTAAVFMMEQAVFPPTDMPPTSLLPAFIFLGFWDALAFGVGVALLIYLAMNFSKWPKELRFPLLVMFLIALWFSLLNWIHDGLHEAGAAPPNFQLLAMVEYGFHFPWLIMAGLLVYCVARISKTYAAKT